MEQTEMTVRSHRGVLILVFGILSIVLAFFWIGAIFGILAWVFANGDIKKMKSGAMDPSGAGLAKTGRICGIVGIAITLVMVILVSAAVSVPIFMRHSEQAQATEVKSAIGAIYNAYQIHKQMFGNTDDYTVEEALTDAGISEDLTQVWEFEVIGNPPRKIVATSTYDHPAGEGRQVAFDVDDAMFYGWGIDEY